MEMGGILIATFVNSLPHEVKGDECTVFVSH